MILDSTLDEKRNTDPLFNSVDDICGDGSELWRPRDLVYRRY